MKEEKDGSNALANPFVVLREEFDDWAVLFDPDSGRGFGLNPSGVSVWKLLDGKHSTEELLKKLHTDAADVPREAAEHLGVFLRALAVNGLAAYDAPCAQDGSEHHTSSESFQSMHSGYEPPQLVHLGFEPAAYGDCCSGTNPTGGTGCNTGSGGDNNCSDGHCTTYAGWCGIGYDPGNGSCLTNGSSAHAQCWCFGNSPANGACGGGACDGYKCVGGSSGPFVTCNPTGGSPSI